MVMIMMLMMTAKIIVMGMTDEEDHDVNDGNKIHHY